jgi:chemotaxis protein MotB
MPKRKKHEEHEEHVNHERWLITYADMITLLMVLFIVLFSMSQVDLARFAKLKASLSSALGSSGPMDGSTGVLEGGNSAIPLADALGAFKQQQAQQLAQRAERASLNETKAAVEAKLAAAHAEGSVSLKVHQRGLVVRIASDKVLFEAGRAELTPQGAELLDQVIGPLAGLPNALRVEGHTDDVPISGAFASNWELSTARATTVLRALAGHGIAPSRLSATGYADQRPVAANDSATARARNRRVEILVEAMTNTGGGA